MGEARRSSTTRRRFVAPLLILCTFIAILMGVRARSWHDLPEWDTGTYYVVANQLNHGQSLYADTWDMKPPGIFYTYAAAMRVTTDWHKLLYGLGVASAAVTLVGIWLITATVSRSAALWACAFWVALCFEPTTSANLPNCESFMNAFIALGWAAFLRLSTPSPCTQGEGRGEGSSFASTAGWAFLAGALFGLASIYKQVAVAPALAIAVGHVFLSPTNTRRRAIAQSIAMLSTIALCWLALFAWFAFTGRAWLFGQTLVSYSRFYSGNPLTNLAGTFTRSAWISAPLLALWPAATLTIVALVLCWRDADDARRRRFAILLLAMLVGSWIAVAAPGHWNAHYFQLLFPAVCVGAGVGSAGLISLRPGLRVVVALAVLATLGPQLDWLREGGANWAAHRNIGWFTATRDDFLKAEALIPEDQPIYVWGDEPWLYVLTNRRCRYAAVWRQHAVEGPLASYLTNRTLEQLKANPPAMIACFGGAWPADHPVVQWMHQEGYTPVAGLNPYPLQCFIRGQDGAATQP
ncbi:MAG TPA: hypothetical protein VH518_13695 [Tepidisphaeraceae bacterium]